jgi:hypothetical protein
VRTCEQSAKAKKARAAAPAAAAMPIPTYRTLATRAAGVSAVARRFAARSLVAALYGVAPSA